MTQNLNDEIAALIKDKDQRDALAALIVEYVQPTHLANEFVGQILSTRALKPGDALVKKVRKGIKVRTLVPGSIHLASEVTVQDRVNHILDGADVKVTYNEWDLDNGDIGTVQSLRAEMAAKLRDFYVNKVFSALTSVWTAVNTPSNYTSVGGTVTATALENAINYINQTVPGGAKVIVGSRAAVTPITKFGAFWTDGTNVAGSQTAIDEIRNSGKLGKYYGVPILAVDQKWDNPADHNALIPTDKILVVGQNVGEFITFGDVREKQWVDMAVTPPQWNLEIYQQFGLILDSVDGIFVLGELA